MLKQNGIPLNSNLLMGHRMISNLYQQVRVQPKNGVCKPNVNSITKLKKLFVSKCMPMTMLYPREVKTCLLPSLSMMSMNLRLFQIIPFMLMKI